MMTCNVVVFSWNKSVMSSRHFTGMFGTLSSGVCICFGSDTKCAEMRLDPLLEQQHLTRLTASVVCR